MFGAKSGLNLLLILSLAVLGSCSIYGGDSDDEDVFEARVTFGFEASDMIPCEGSEMWWIEGSQNSYTQLYGRWQDLGLEWYQHAYARLEGNPSERGSFGHLGAYQRKFEVTEVVEVRELEEDECPFALNR